MKSSAIINLARQRETVIMLQIITLIIIIITIIIIIMILLKCDPASKLQRGKEISKEFVVVVNSAIP